MTLQVILDTEIRKLTPVSPSVTKFTFLPSKTPQFDRNDVIAMFERLKKEFNPKEKFRGISQIKTVYGNHCRTTKAHYHDPDFMVYDQEDVVRVTITASGFDCNYIEYRMTPYLDLGRKQEINGTEEGYINFSSKHQAYDFFKLLYSKEYFIEFQKKLDANSFRKNKHIISVWDNIITIHCAIDDVFNFLVESNKCPKEAVDQLHEVLRSDKNISISPK